MSTATGNTRWTDDALETTLLPEQVLAPAVEGDPLHAVKRLMVAVLEEAAACIAATGDRDVHVRRRRRDAARWLRSDDRSGLFSFASICDTLGIEPPAIRDHLLVEGPVARCQRRSSRSNRVEANLTSIVAPRVRRRRRRAGDGFADAVA